jgi:2-dehydro-3-deoxyphosphogalactonate aldolase
MMDLDHALQIMPLIAILRGVRPEECEGIGEALVGAGFTIIEVPLNSPGPLDSVERLSRRFGSQALIGAGTVLSEADVGRVAEAGGGLIVSPNMNPAVIARSKALGLISAPGVATASEGFAALAAGADVLKLFPGEQVTPQVLKALRAVFPPETRMVPVGGVNAQTMGPYLAAGASGFGIGSSLYRPGSSASEVAARAAELVRAWGAAHGQP